jgi:hypothetical protein
LRNEASKLSDLRGRLRADRLTRTSFGPPPEYEVGMAAVVDRVTQLLREDHPGLVHDFMRDIPPSFLSTVLPTGGPADRLDHEMKIRCERLNDIIQRLEQPTPRPAAQSPPALSFGRPELAKHPHPIYLPDHNGEQHLLASGRIVRVPVINAQGASDALRVHARLRFLIERQWGPGETEAEWEGQDGPEVEIDLLGNGRPRLINIVAVLNWEYPHAYEWTGRSRAALLRGYAIKATPFSIEVTVSGLSGYLRDTLEIDCRGGHMIKADWLGPSRDPANGDTWVGWT